MSVALQTNNLPPEAIALIKAGTPRPQSLPQPIELSVTKTVATETKTPNQTSDREEPTGQNSNANPMTSDSAAFEKETPAPPKGGGTPLDAGQPASTAYASCIAMTVRVPSKLPTRLLRAATDRKINRQWPFTQQQIVAQALEQWLQTHGY
jgi:hypothetical protein